MWLLVAESATWLLGAESGCVFVEPRYVAENAETLLMNFFTISGACPRKPSF
jgi:hypothetical protein